MSVLLANIKGARAYLSVTNWDIWTDGTCDNLKPLMASKSRSVGEQQS